MHVESATLALEGWHDFYLLLGTAAAALVALLFVAVSIGVGYLTSERAVATRVFFSPLVIHFSAVLVISAISLTPATHPAFIEAALMLTGLVGIVVSGIILVHLARAEYEGMVFFDNLGYGGIPATAYATIIVAAFLAARGWNWSLHLLGASVMTLILINIRNAWDLMLTVVRRQSSVHNP
jgi:hypothetical protein